MGIQSEFISSKSYTSILSISDTLIFGILLSNLLYISDALLNIFVKSSLGITSIFPFFNNYTKNKSYGIFTSNFRITRYLKYKS